MAFFHWQYKDEANKKMVFTSSGELELNGNMDIESGALVEVKSGGELEVESGGILDINAGGQVRHYVEVLSTASTGAALSPFGVSIVKSTKTDDSFTLATPAAAGVMKTIICIGGSATGSVRVNCSSGAKFDGTNWIWDFKKGSVTAPETVQVVASATNRWYEIYRSSADGTAIASTDT